MFREKRVGVVVPAYNEEGFVGEVIDTMPPFVDRIYVVDDASTDDTWTEITERASDDRVVPIRHEENRGVGGAIKTGYRQALDDRIDVTAVMGGDGQMDPQYLSDLITPIVGGYAEYVKADRLGSTDLWRGMSRWRLFGNFVLSMLTRITSGYWGLSDPQNGYTAIGLPALKAVDLDSMYEYYGYCNDILVKLNVNDMRVADVPVPAVYGDEESSIDYPSYIYRVSGMLARNFLWRLRAKYVGDGVHPLVVCYTLSGGLLAASVALALAGVVWLLMPVALTGLALVFLLIGVELDRRANRDLEVPANV
jgi:glycosyltransferase involved in cell wall biosynthesis